MPAPNSSSAPKVQIVHSLLRARDWQDRPEFEQVCEWWRKGGRGVLALVGIGGAGKTAIANRFMNALPEVTEMLPGQPKDASLRVPEWSERARQCVPRQSLSTTK